MLLPDVHPVPYPPYPSPSPPAVRPYDDTNNLGSITVELNFLDAGPKKAPAPFDTERMHSDFKVKDFPNQVFTKNQPFFYQTEGKPILLARVTGLEVLDPSVLKAKKPSSQSVAQDHGVLGLKTEVFFERAKGAPASLQPKHTQHLSLIHI